ncbi:MULTISPECIES: M23 family metallopeptidase [Stenotrophomonas]|uniref:M23 family metallopeptidase n=1 Tax=Stenotrophomonas TaxID=40323 RepID=UPI0012FE5C71|nr:MULTISPECIES: M23 family metallopeptidase [Stenotrophomonas]
MPSPRNPLGIGPWLLLAALLPGALVSAATVATPPLAPVEARIPFAPAPFTGSDGARHLAYELHISNFYGDTGTLVPQRLQVLADTSDAPLLNLDGAALSAWARPAAAEGAPPSIAAGKRLVLFLWLTLPADAPIPLVLRHHIDFATEKAGITTLDGTPVNVGTQPLPVLGPPLRGGRWLAHEGPGAAQSHHWGSLVAVNGALTIPQRFALDLVGVDAQGRAVHAAPAHLQDTRHQDWVGYAAPVLAVADGVVRDVRDGEPEHRPLTPQPEPASLTSHGLFGNYVVLEISPGVFASYAHLRKGSIKVKPGQRVQRGQVLGALGQSGNSAAPHLHFQLSNGVRFEGSEGIPYVFDQFQYFGPETEAQLFGQGESWTAPPAQLRQQELPLNDVVIGF